MSLPNAQPATPKAEGLGAGAAASTPLLMTKLYVPRARQDVVSRPRLEARLGRGLAAPLILISAPAGFGKTTVAAQWTGQINMPVAWLSLDVSDNEPSLFLRYVIAALQSVAPQIGTNANALLQGPQPPTTSTLLTLVLNDLAALDHDLLLVMDDYHLVHNAAVHEAVQFLLQRLPPQFRLVIITREDPPFPLTTMRAQRRLAELRARDLRFSLDEAATLLRVMMGLQVTDAEIQAVETRTEGWVAGLHLAALAMQNRGEVQHFVQAFTGTNRFILEYLVEEVVERLPAHLRDFLLRTSILERFCAPLCDAVILGGVSDRNNPVSRLLIEQIERMNLFVIPLDDQRQWYRFHHLFADALRERLKNGAAPAQLSALYTRASQWCESEGLIVEAINYAIRSGDSNRTADLLERYGDIMTMQRGPAVLIQWIVGLPRELLALRPQLALTYSWGLILTDHFAEAEALLNEAEPAIQAQSPDGRGALAEQAAAQRTTIALMTEASPSAIIAIGRHTFDIISDPLSPAARSTGLMLGCGYALHGEDLAALQTWQAATEACQATGDGLMEVVIAAHLARVLPYRGELRQVDTLLRRLLARADEPYLQAIPTRAYAWTFLAWILYEQNALAEALRCCKDSIELSKAWSMPRFTFFTHVINGLAKQTTGDPIGAQESMNSALRMIEQNNLKQPFLSVPAYQARLWLMQGKLEAATGWMEPWEAKLRAPLEPAYDLDYLTVARVFFAHGRLEEADNLITRVLARVEALGRTGYAIEAYALQALVAHAQHDHDRAIAALTSALTRAEPQGYIRTFVDFGAPMHELLQEVLAHDISPAYCERLLAAFPQQEPAEPPQAERANPRTLRRSNALPEPLNEREREVLGLIAQGLSNQQIADRLVVALSTVKWHINNLYGKLDVGTRTQALARAAELDLIS